MQNRRRKAARVEVVALRDLRKKTGLTQAEAAEAGSLLQGDISKLENRVSFDVVTLGTLRRYVEALGGKLQMRAVLGAKTYELELTGVEEDA